MPPVFGMQAALTAPVDEQTGDGPSSSTASHPFDFSKRRLRIARLIHTEDHARFEALRKIKVLVLINPSTSELGRTLIAGAALLRSDQQLGSSIIDSFASKATGTLVKRAGALWRFARFCASNGIQDPLAANEATLYQYMQYLKVNGAATTANDFLQSWRFLHHAIGLKSGPIEDVVSSRVKGAADGMFATKRKLVQAAPLTTMMVLALEKIVLNGPYIHWRLIAGHLLLCLGSCSRFADSIRLDNIMIDEHEGTYLIEAAEASYKTATTRERKARLLPILCLGRFFAHEPWAPVWMRLRAEARFGNDPSLRAFSEITSTWMERAMSTGEASLFLQEFLIGSGFKTPSLTGISTRSLKCTLLSYVAKGNYTPLPDRRILGHHIEVGDNSAITYSRDELSRLMIKVDEMLQDIRAGRFKPDDRRVQRIAEQSKANDCLDYLSDDEVEASDSDDFSADDLERSPMGLEPSRTAFDDLTLESVCNSRIHVHSGVLHVFDPGSATFACGRKRTANYRKIDDGAFPTDVPVCIQCAKSLPRSLDSLPEQKGHHSCEGVFEIDWFTSCKLSM